MTTPLYIDAGPSGRGWSRIGTAKTCAQAYAWRYLARVDASSAPGRSTGQVGHAAVCHHYARLGAAQPGGIWIDGNADRPGRQITDPNEICTPEDAITIATQREYDNFGIHANEAGIREAFSRYVIEYGNERMKVISVEGVLSARIPCTPHTVPILDWPEDVHMPPTQIGERTVEYYDYSARLDLLFERGGLIYIADHKFHGQVYGSHTKTAQRQASAYAMSGQFVGLRWLGMLAYGPKFGGLILNIAQTQPPWNLQRPPLAPTPHLLNRFPLEVIEAEQRIEALEAALIPLAHWPKAMSELVCYHKYGACDHVSRCAWGTRTRS